MDRRAGTGGQGCLQAPQGAELTLWQLPQAVQLGDKNYPFCADFRDILEIFSYWEDPDLPDFVKWEIALALFYREPVAASHKAAAMEYLAGFVAGFQPQKDAGARLLDWSRDAHWIVSDINQVAGQEIRALPFVHWWTFLAWFHAIGQGQLSALVAVRRKLAAGKKLEGWEMDFYRENRERICLPRRQSRQELLEKKRLCALLAGERRE